MGMPGYIPCNKPATQIIRAKDGVVIAMCDMCADHNTRNRGATLIGPYQSEGYVSPFANDPLPMGDQLAAIGGFLDQLRAREAAAEEERRERERIIQEGIEEERRIGAEAIKRLDETLDDF